MADVAIVGGGPVGMVAALELIARGISVTVLERRSEPRDSSRSIGIHPPALDVLDGLGCADAVIDAGVRVREGEVRCGGAVLGMLSFRSASPRHPYVLSVPQHVTERMLRATLAARAPEALLTGCEVTGCEQTATGVRLETSRGPVEAGWAIGADGPRSIMRTLGGFAVGRRAYPDRYVMADAPDRSGLGERAVLYLESDGVVESFPLPGGRRRWVLHRGADRAALDASELADTVRRRTGVAVDGGTIGDVSSFGVGHVWARAAVRGRIALVGDAAHEISPIGGQGMTLGWLDASELAAALAQVIGGGPRDALAAYAARAAKRERMTARQAFFNTAMGRPRHGRMLAARNVIVRAMAGPRFERRIAAAFTMAAPAAVTARGYRGST
ncbi:FAD-dependent oxidoreductase [Gryllotalpicola reticulitermitis]|uniref:FAD-dependent oxidoreductase n=1 Tax=Gryllotalpicola reticulitermitis TaxID=1184153 RepID=A0ABV8PZS9_9MICO